MNIRRGAAVSALSAAIAAISLAQHAQGQSTFPLYNQFVSHPLICIVLALIYVRLSPTVLLAHDAYHTNPSSP